MTIRKLQFRRLANTAIANTIGSDGELIIDTMDHAITVHDGVRPGGYKAVGSVGPQGSPGSAGPQGLAGAPGTNGTQGDPGATGPQGSPGSNGDIGPQGPQGPTGAQGESGLGFIIAKTYSSVASLQADTNPTDIIAGEFAIIDTGDVENPDDAKLYLWNGTVYSFVTDLSGASGIQGQTGPTGPQGPQGAEGVNGSIGPQGAEGAIGPQGTTGSTGPQGAAGSTGPQGTQGTQGSQGTSGTNGSQGPQGATGPQGSTGPQGVAGTNGTNGTQGPQGTAGTNGTNGATGPQGSTGPQGVAGTNGTNGATGPQGPQGTAGTNGTNGATGPQGPQGVQGSTGPQGPGGTVANYGSFYDMQTQTVSTINTATPMKLRITDSSNGVSIQGANNSQITVSSTGTYNLQFSAQFNNTGGGGSGSDVLIWLRKNGQNIANTSTDVSVITNSPYIVASWNFVEPLNSGDNLELMWSSNNLNIQMVTAAQTAWSPAIPSVIVTLTPVVQTLAGPTGPQGATGTTNDVGQFAQANAAFNAANTAASIIPQNAQSTSYTLALSDSGKHIYSTNTSTQVITIPNNGTVSWNIGSTVMLVIQGSGKMNVVPSTGVTMYLANNSTSKAYANVYSYGMATLLNVAANTWFINGAGVA